MKESRFVSIKITKSIFYSYNKALGTKKEHTTGKHSTEES